MTPNKGRERFKRQCKTMLYNMSTRAGAIDGLNWVECRDTVRAQKGFTTRQIEGLRRTWAAMDRDPKRLPWVEFLQANRA